MANGCVYRNIIADLKRYDAKGIYKPKLVTLIVPITLILVYI